MIEDNRAAAYNRLMRNLMIVFAAVAFGTMLQAQLPSDTPAPITIQAYVDGPSELHVTTKGIYWINGPNAKPGRWNGANEPTYVSGEKWVPLWRYQREDRGPDRSFSYVIPSDSLDLDCKLITVAHTQAGTGIKKRTPISFGMEGTEYVVHIPDPEPGPMWYTFVLSPHKAPGE
jgi:hypothetical protein